MLGNDDKLQQLSFKHIPVLPPGAPYLLKALTDESLSFVELAAVIERYPTIAARLISLSNSAWSSPVSEITSVEMACSRLGFDVVRSASIALAVSAPFDTSRCQAFDTRFFWCTSLLAADGVAGLVKASKAGDIEHSYAGTDVARSGLKFKPEFSLEQGLEKTFEWYRQAQHRQ